MSRLRDRTKPWRVALIVDNPYRDLAGLVLVAMRLCQEGATCYLVPFNLHRQELGAIAPDFVLLNYLRTHYEWLARLLIEAGIQVGVLDTEGGVLLSFEAYERTLLKDEWARRRISCFCSWGPRLADHAVAAGWFNESQIAVTGSPRMDFYAYPWREAAMQASAKFDRYSQNLVLFNGNFVLANPAFASPQAEARALVSRVGYDSEMVKSWQEADRQAMEQLARLASNLAARFPQATFVYRPHPFERLETYEGLLDRRDNLHLIKEGTIDGWIIRARAVVQRSCTTAIEAGLAGVPALSPLWIPTTWSYPAADAVRIPCNTEAELIEALHDILAGQFDYPDHIKSRLDQVISDWFLSVDGRAYERVALTILDRLSNKEDRVRRRQCLDLHYGLGHPDMSRRYRLKTRMRRVLRLPLQWSFSEWRFVTESTWDHSDKYFDDSHVRQLADAIYACSQLDDGHQLGPVDVKLTRERDDYMDYIGPYYGRSVTMSPAERWSELTNDRKF